ncbi:Aste57867_15129 [Aphanomyces stellatus]|uniref:Aste57867_15129 protein n=1 Tax=Aphanomyces stellatus TaxID=120398 RepID=A0A485L2P2_9STRA|nr:hypothetical protein As57867_015073 [Aphanomyces stellatus]VFT91939.1 Aste57867_15129 [Aphanomyces stellatus]
MHASMMLSLALKKQFVVDSLRQSGIHAAAVAFEELALLRHTDSSLAGLCDAFLQDIQPLLEPRYVIASVWGKAQVGLVIKLDHLERTFPSWKALADAKKKAMADDLITLRRRNQMMSKMLRDHPRATERGFSQTDALTGVVFRALQRLSIDVAVLTESTLPNTTAASVTSTANGIRRIVSFDARGPQVMGTADANVDRRPIAVTPVGNMEMLLIRGSRVLPVV